MQRRGRSRCGWSCGLRAFARKRQSEFAACARRLNFELAAELLRKRPHQVLTDAGAPDTAATKTDTVVLDAEAQIVSSLFQAYAHDAAAAAGKRVLDRVRH